MQDKLRAFIDTLFEDAPAGKKAVELKEEMLQNLNDKYNDLLSEGKSEEAAYNLAVASVGDVGELLRYLRREEGASSSEQENLMRYRRRSAIVVPIAVILYILSIIPVMLSDRRAGVVSMFAMIAVATGLLIWNSMSKPVYVRQGDTVVEEFKEWKMQNGHRRQAFRSISGAIWSAALAVYFILSFTTMAWHITWVIFLITAAVNSIIKAIFDLKE